MAPAGLSYNPPGNGVAVSTAKRLLVLTRDRGNASFRQRIEPYLQPLSQRGIAAEVVELAESPLTRPWQWRAARECAGILLQRKTLSAWDAWCLDEACPLIYDFDDAVMYQARAPGQPNPTRLRRFERTVRRANVVIAGSPYLARYAGASGARRVETAPTGLDLARFPPKTTYGRSGDLRLVWIGSASTLRQLEPFRPMFEALGRAMPEVRLRVVADAALEAPGLRVENVPWSLEAEARLLAESDVGIAPLPDTPYTRGKCGFKVLQYMAAGLPVIASPVGVNADYVQPDATGLWAKTPEEWIEAARRLAGDAALCERMGRAGRRRVEAEFDFRVLAPKVVDLVASALA